MTMNKINTNKQNLVVLVGPTATGKTNLALNLAQKINTEIISADSASVYSYLDLGTAKPTPEEQELVKHHLIDVVKPDKLFSVANYQKLALQAINNLAKDKKTPFLVGGTGLYIDSITKNYSFGKHGSNPLLRKELSIIASKEGGREYLYKLLTDVDPVSSDVIHPNDLKRIIRALEFYKIEGVPISQQVKETQINTNPFNTLIYGITMERNMLYKRIETRVDKMIKLGFVDEVKSLLEMGYEEKDPGLKVLGYRQLVEYITGKVDLQEAVSSIKKETRNLAKRQITWFKRNENIRWYDMSEVKKPEKIVENIYTEVKELLG